MSETRNSKSKRSFWKLIPGLGISAFFLWKTLRSIRMDDLRAIRILEPWWLLAVLFCLCAGYGTRILRWWFMLRPNGGARLTVCARVLLTSFAANNVLPFRIGDFLRIFSYAGDLGASSSTVLSTVLLERVLDIFSLLVLLVALLMLTARTMPPFQLIGHAVSLLHVAVPLMVVAGLGLATLLFGGRLLQRICHWLLLRLPANSFTGKADRLVLLLFDAVLKLTVSGRLGLIGLSGVAWLFEAMTFLAIKAAIAIPVGSLGPWFAVTLSNLSFLIPSSPGGIGTYEFACQFAMVSQGAAPVPAALYGVLVHAIVFVFLTGLGGAVFLLHRLRRGPEAKPLLQDLEELPAELPVDLR